MPETSESKPVLIPGPDHPITVEPTAPGCSCGPTARPSPTRETRSRCARRTIPRSSTSRSRMSTCHCSSRPRMRATAPSRARRTTTGSRTARATRAPSGSTARHAAVAEIKGRVAFYPDRVERIEQLTDAASRPGGSAAQGQADVQSASSPIGIRRALPVARRCVRAVSAPVRSGRVVVSARTRATSAVVRPPGRGRAGPPDPARAAGGGSAPDS